MPICGCCNKVSPKRFHCRLSGEKPQEAERLFKPYVSADEFMRIALDPANIDRRLQRIDGEIVELISSYNASVIAATLTCEVGIFVKQHKLGYMTGADCGYTICGEQYI